MLQERPVQKWQATSRLKEALEYVARAHNERHGTQEVLGALGKPQLATRHNSKTHRGRGDEESRRIRHGEQTRHHEEDGRDRKIPDTSCSKAQMLCTGGYYPKPAERRESTRAVLLDSWGEHQAEDSSNDREEQKIGLIEAPRPRTGRGAVSFEQGHRQVDCHQREQHRQHLRVVLRHVEFLRPAEKQRTGEREQEAEMDEWTPAALPNHHERYQTRGNIVTVHRERAGVLECKRRRNVGADHTQYRDRERAPCYGNNRRSARHYKEQPERLDIGDVVKQAVGAVGSQISNGKGRTGQSQ